MTELYRYQRQGVYLIKRFGGRALLADDMGLGKSLQSLEWMVRNDAFPTIIVCPASVRWTWELECLKHYGIGSSVLEGRKPKGSRRSIDYNKIVIINYDILRSWLPYLKELKPELLIIDEAHYISNPRAKRTRLVKRLAKDVPYVIACSGTPLTSRPRQLFPILNLLRPDLFPYWRPFGYRYCNPKLTPWGFNYDGASNLSELNETLREEVMIRRTKKQVLKELPSKTRIIVPVGISDWREYALAQNDFIRWLRETKGDVKASRAKNAHRVVQIGYLSRLASSLKMNSIFDWIDNFLLECPGEKLVVFGIHKSVLKGIYERYKSQSVIIDGSVVGRNRKRAVEKFSRTKACRLLIGNYKAAGVGLDFTCSSNALCVEFPWTPADVIQAEDRLCRIGQKLPVSIYYMIARGTIEEKHCRIIQEKQEDILDRVLDGREGASEFSVFDLLEQEFLK